MLAASASEPCETAEVRALLSIPFTQRGEYDRAAKLAEEAGQAAEAVGDHWAAAVAGIVAAERAAVAGDIASVAALAARAIQHSEAIDYLVTLLPGTLLQAWAAERRGETEVAIDAYRRAIELANQAGLTDHTAFALARMGAVALAGGDVRQAEDLCRRALAAADAEVSPWTAEYTRVQLGRVLAATGDADTAARLYRSALESSERPQPHRARESLQLMLAGSPHRAALVGLAELADARGDVAAADELRARAQFASA
jgi:tetratricopeptide (TPR) repeat protein